MQGLMYLLLDPDLVIPLVIPRGAVSVKIRHLSVTASVLSPRPLLLLGNRKSAFLAVVHPMPVCTAFTRARVSKARWAAMVATPTFPACLLFLLST